MRPRRPNAGTHNAKLLDALLAAYPHATWSPSSKLQITANSRAAALRRLGWDVQGVHRTHPQTGRVEWGYVLRMPPSSIASARRAATTMRPVLSFADRLVDAAEVAEQTGMTLKQLRYLDRVGSIPFDLDNGSGGKYLAPTVRLLQGLGVLVGLGIGLDTALVLLRQHADDLATAVRLVAPERAEVVAS